MSSTGSQVIEAQASASAIISFRFTSSLRPCLMIPTMRLPWTRCRRQRCFPAPPR
jgi:hypothetical protein